MLILDYVKPEDATDKVAEAYSIFPEQVPVPEPLLMMSASPDLALKQSEILHYFMLHDKLDAGVLAMIRFLVANELGYAYCINFNTRLLKLAGGLSDEDLAALKADPENIPLESHQQELVRFVLKVVRAPEQVTLADINTLHELGWSDQDIFDAAYHGTYMMSAANLYKAFNK